MEKGGLIIDLTVNEIKYELPTFEHLLLKTSVLLFHPEKNSIQLFRDIFTADIPFFMFKT